MAVRLLLSDIDGTILPKGATRVSERTLSVFRLAMDAGLYAGPASGRGRDWIPPFFGGDEALCATCLATNGLQVYLDGELVHEECQPREALEAVVPVVESTPGAGLICFDGPTPLLVAGRRQDLARSFEAYARTCVESAGVPGFPVVKAAVFVAADMDGTQELVARLREEVPALDFDLALPGYSNVMPHGYDKGTGVRLLCDELGIGVDEVVAFGDADNDLPMFSVVRDSVAVANSTPEAAAAARWHIGRCEEDAVAVAIEAVARGEWPFSL